MKGKIMLSTIHVLCIVAYSFPFSWAVENVTEISSEEEKIRALFVSNGTLLETWSNNLTQFTEDIDLSNLGIETLDMYTFVKFHKLNAIDLSLNKLRSTRNVVDALQYRGLLILNLSHNNLGSLTTDQSSSATYGLPVYRQTKTFLFNSQYFWSIDVSCNGLRGLGIDFDAAYLNLSGNHLQCHNAIEPQRFAKKSIYVGNLDLSNNFIDCQNSFFTSTIHTLDMSRNKLTSLGPGLFKKSELLTKLNLSYNHIRYIHPQAFEHTFHLRHLDLQFNQIRSIYKQVWCPIPSLKFIDLSSNQLEHVEWELVAFIREPSIHCIKDWTEDRIKVNVKNNSNVQLSSHSTDDFDFCMD